MRWSTRVCTVLLFCGCGDAVDPGGQLASNKASTCSIDLTSPSDGAVLGVGDTPRFQWTDDCEGGWIEISHDPSFPLQGTLYFSATGRSEIVVPRTQWNKVQGLFADGGTWRIVGDAGDAEVTSETMAFSTSVRPISSVPSAATCGVVLDSPTDGTALPSTAPSLAFTGDCDAYRIELSDTPDFDLANTLPFGSVRSSPARLPQTLWDNALARLGSLVYWRVVGGAIDGEHASEVGTMGTPPDDTVPTTEVQLAWDAPTTNADGTTLTDLAEYRVYYGTTTPVTQTNSAMIATDATATTATVSGLEAGTWYFSVTAVDTSDNESALSSELGEVVEP